jgi:hypothetical protein
VNYKIYARHEFSWGNAQMSFTNATPIVEVQTPTEVAIASLAEKFYLDSNCQEAYDRKHWLCAEFMLAQQHLIRCQITSIHERALAGAA